MYITSLETGNNLGYTFTPIVPLSCDERRTPPGTTSTITFPVMATSTYSSLAGQIPCYEPTYRRSNIPTSRLRRHAWCRTRRRRPYLKVRKIYVT